MATVKLWSDEVEAMRAEAREAVAKGSDFFPTTERDDPTLSRDERVARGREAMLASTFPVDDAEQRDIAGVRCKIFRAEGTPRAIYLHFHGGGMVSGSPEMMDLPNQHLAKQLGVTVVSADYRKAPEHPYPAGPDDGLAVARWLLTDGAAEFGSERMLIGGESAGGYMTLITALRIRDQLHAIDRVDGLNLIFGVFDWGRSPSQRGMRPQDGMDVLSPEGIEFFTGCYLPGMTDDERRAPEISPAFADLRGLPPSLVSVGSCDHLLDDSLFVATRAAAAGVDVDLFVAPDMPHGFLAFDCGITRLWSQHQQDWLEARLNR
jgi:acetyl esterase/lipase